MADRGWTVRPALVASALQLHLSARPVDAQQAGGRLDALQPLNGSMAAIAERVSKSVVQVIVTSYGPVDRQTRTDTNLVIELDWFSGT
jgi:hypothetical protein